jgi:hypothetical protein
MRLFVLARMSGLRQGTRIGVQNPFLQLTINVKLMDCFVVRFANSTKLADDGQNIGKQLLVGSVEQPKFGEELEPSGLEELLADFLFDFRRIDEPRNVGVNDGLSVNQAVRSSQISELNSNPPTE